MKRAEVLALLVAASVFGPVACHPDGSSSSSSGGERGSSDAGVRDGGRRDSAVGARVRDASVADSGSVRTEVRDAGRGDASVRSNRDAGRVVDAGLSGASRWGASREEQCATPPRPSINATARATFAEGVSLVSRGDLNTASSRFSRCLSEDRQAYAAAYNLGVLSDRQGREAEALDYYRQALRIVPSYEDSIEAIVLLHLRRGRTQEAASFIEPLATTYSFSARIQAARARVLSAMGRWDEAERAARRGLLCDERSVAGLTAFALAANGQGNVALATWVLDRIAQIEATDPPSPSFAESHLLRGQIARTRPGELERALHEFEKAVELRPDYVDARMALGQMMLSSGAYPDALQHLYAAAAAAPWSWQVRLAYADSLRAVRRFDEAKREIDRTVELAPNQPEAHLSLGLLYMEQADCLRTSDFSAIATCQRAVAELTAYRNGMGSRLPATDRTQEYVTSLTRILSRLTNARDQQQREGSGGGSGATP